MAFSLKFTLISLIIVSTLIFFIFFTNSSVHNSTIPVIPKRSLINLNTTTIHCSSIHHINPQYRCDLSRHHCSGDSDGLVNYLSLHFCTFNGKLSLSIPFLSLTVVFQFYVLVKTAQDRFSFVVTKLATHLRLSASMGAVTLLALGNGAPDVFASVAAVGGGQARTGFGAILSAGTFVSAFVVGFVAIYAAPFSVEPAPFVRDVLFYLTAALLLFCVYLSGEIYLWQAVGFVCFYLFFVGFVFWMDLGLGNSRKKKIGFELGFTGDDDANKNVAGNDFENGESMKKVQAKDKLDIGFWRAFEKISTLWRLPVSLLLNLTIPQSSPSEWNRFYRSANIILCPLLLLTACKSFMPINHPIIFLIPNTHFPLWLVVLFSTTSLAAVHFLLESKPPETEQIPATIAAFVMSVFWISFVAGELLNCLAVLGILLHVPAALLGLTVLAWGNSVGDLVADVAVAKAGRPAMAMAGCFAGPMFNMLFGLGTALVMQTWRVYPDAYVLRFHVSIAVAFVFLFLSLMGSLFVVTLCRFRVPRVWGFCLVGLYSVFITVSVIIARFSG
jgi:sodium/potassium/calcium exchanger 6